ncbi:unnamed protein product [Clavelina lepadiformis]|uniref:non-specific serine/threonine protein kinase n=1 Tax=Clavelina lepadiformis TaxID=159417 RepID=A0ABP0FQE2_CLALP
MSKPDEQRLNEDKPQLVQPDNNEESSSDESDEQHGTSRSVAMQAGVPHESADAGNQVLQTMENAEASQSALSIIDPGWIELVRRLAKSGVGSIRITYAPQFYHRDKRQYQHHDERQYQDNRKYKQVDVSDLKNVNSTQVKEKQTNPLEQSSSALGASIKDKDKENLGLPTPSTEEVSTNGPSTSEQSSSALGASIKDLENLGLPTPSTEEVSTNGPSTSDEVKVQNNKEEEEEMCPVSADSFPDQTDGTLSESTHTETGENCGKYDFGLLHCTKDKKIAKRVVNLLQCCGHSAIRYCDFSVGFGKAHAYKPEHFFLKSWCILWIATDTSVVSVKLRGPDQKPFDVMYDLSTEEKEDKFFAFVPYEHSGIKLPTILRPYRHISECKNSAKNFYDFKKEVQTMLKTIMESHHYGSKVEWDGGKQQEINMNDFETNGILGEGAYGRVLHVESKVDRKDYAIKILHLPSAEQSNQICKEAKTMKSLQHKNIVRYINSWSEHCNELFSTVYIQMEFCSKGTLRQAIKDDLWKDLTKKLKFCIDILEGLVYLHKEKLIHRDLKPENIFVDKNDVIKIGDFGFTAKRIKEVCNCFKLV